MPLHLLSFSDSLLAAVTILFGLLLVIYQWISWFHWERIVKMTIWWNKHVWPRHQEPYLGPSDAMRKASNIYGIFLVLLGLGLIAFGIMVFIFVK